MHPAGRFLNLLNLFTENKLTAEEEREFVLLHQSGRYNDFLDLDIRIKLQSEYENIISLSEEKSQKILGSIIGERAPAVHRVHFLRTAWFRYAAAILIIAGIGTYLWNTNKTVETSKPNIAKVDIPAGGNKAILVLGDESVINLDTAADGKLVSQGGAEVIKTADGEIFYNTALGNNQGIFYQKLITPKGGQYQVTLADGSQVWLNAESSIRFPSIFSESTREVEVTGEVYFEVKTNKSKPFIVRVLSPAGGSGGARRNLENPHDRRDAEGGQEIIVLGTSFNVNSYTNEPYSKTSLLKGSIKISDKILKPGQAYINGKITTTNTARDIAWKNGFFNFSEQDFATSMRQLARWYNIEIVYDGDIPKGTFSGQVDRSLNLYDAIELLDGVVAKFKLEGRKLHVLKK